jgi:hypothetical protein
VEVTPITMKLKMTGSLVLDVSDLSAVFLAAHNVRFYPFNLGKAVGRFGILGNRERVLALLACH